MKKTKFLALVLVVAIMMMGAGYAAWQETLVINHSVSTGNVDIDLSNGSVVVHADDFGSREGDKLARTATVVGVEQEATVTVTNLYPGAKVIAKIPVKNNGTIPVKYASIERLNVPSWLTVTEVCPQALAVDGTGEIVVTMIVGDDAVENDLDVTFTLKPLYKQFNAK